VPLEAEPLRELAAAGFVGLHYVKLGEAPCFHMDGVEMRELKLAGRQPAAEAAKETRWVLYKGPFAQVTDYQGTVFPRGQRVAVSVATWDQFWQGPEADQFLFVHPDAKPMCGGG
jgi:hypothetical protein